MNLLFLLKGCNCLLAIAAMKKCCLAPTEVLTKIPGYYKDVRVRLTAVAAAYTTAVDTCRAPGRVLSQEVGTSWRQSKWQRKRYATTRKSPENNMKNETAEEGERPPGIKPGSPVLPVMSVARGRPVHALVAAAPPRPQTTSCFAGLKERNSSEIASETAFHM